MELTLALILSYFYFFAHRTRGVAIDQVAVSDPIARSAMPRSLHRFDTLGVFGNRG